MLRLIDTHAHLDSSIYERDLDIVVRHALDEGVWTVTVGNDLESSRRAVEIASRYPRGVFAAVGLHPSKVPADITAEDKLLDLGAFYELAAHPKVVALGETGLDFSDLQVRDRRDPMREMYDRLRDNQRKVFGKFLDISRELRLPLLVHCRDAHEEMLEMLETWDKTTRGFDSRGIVHCFSGTWKQARRYFNVDFMVSVTGTLTHGGYQSEILKKAPLSRLVGESDCPYLTAVPWSIRRSEPSYVASVAAGIAGMRGMRSEDVERQLLQNALSVFPKMRNGATER